MKAVDTFECRIYSGLKEGYLGKIHTISEVEQLLQAYCDNVGFAFTVTSTRFIYTNGNEDGCIIGIINYPRFPRDPSELMEIAINITKILLKELKQQRISIVCSDKTYMLEAEDAL